MANQFAAINKHIQPNKPYKTVGIDLIVIVLSKKQTTIKNEKTKIFFSPDINTDLL